MTSRTNRSQLIDDLGEQSAHHGLTLAQQAPSVLGDPHL